MTTNAADLVHALQRYGNRPDERNRYLSGSPSFPDEYPTYTDATGFNAGARNPFAAYSTNVEEISRQPFNWLESAQTVLVAGDVRLRSCVIKLLEPIFSPIINWQERDVQCLFGIQNIDLTLSLTSNLKSAIFAGVPSALTLAGTGNGYANMQVDISTTTKPVLHVLYITPQPDQEIPSLLHYPYYECSRYINDGETLQASTRLVDGAVNAIAQTTVNNIALHSIPERLYIYAKPRRAGVDNDVLIPNVFARIHSIDMNFNNRAGVFSSYSEYDLYRISVQAGCDQAWPEWNSYQGSILCIDSGINLPLNPLEAAGSRGNYQFQYRLRYSNLLDVIAQYQIYTIAIGEGFMTINDSTVSLDLGVLTEQSVRDAESSELPYYEVMGANGGGLLGTVWKGIKKGAKIARNIGTPLAGFVGDVAGMVPHPIAQAVSKGAKTLNAIGKATGGRRAGGRASGGDLSGGAQMSKRSLSRRV